MQGDLKARVEALERLANRAGSMTDSVEREIGGMWGRAREIEVEQMFRRHNLGGGSVAPAPTPSGNVVITFIGCSGEPLAGVLAVFRDASTTFGTETSGADGKVYFNAPDFDEYVLETTGPTGYQDTTHIDIEVAGTYTNTISIWGDQTGTDPFFCFGNTCVGVRDGSTLTVELSRDGGSTWDAMTWDGVRFTFTGGSPSRIWVTDGANTNLGARVSQVRIPALGYTWDITSHDCGGNELTLTTTASPLPVDLNTTIKLRLT